MIKQRQAALARVPTDKLLPLLRELVALLETQQAIAPPKQVAVCDDLGPLVPEQIRIRLLLDSTYLSGVRLIKLLNQHPRREWPALLERMALAGMRQVQWQNLPIAPPVLKATPPVRTVVVITLRRQPELVRGLAELPVSRRVSKITDWILAGFEEAWDDLRPAQAARVGDST
jgi:hypothetical protein